jgi:hypothetical protein
VQLEEGEVGLGYQQVLVVARIADERHAFA